METQVATPTANSLKLIEELLFCWFRYHLPREFRPRLINLLEIISRSKSEILFPLFDTDYMVVFRPQPNQQIRLVIRRVRGAKDNDKRLAFMAKMLRAAQQKPRNEYLRAVQAELTDTELIFLIPHEH